MRYLLAFFVFIFINSIIYMNFEIEGFLIYNFSVITIFLVMIYDKISKKSADMNSSKSYITEQNKLKQQLFAIDEANSSLKKEDI
ncbi:hypothetical protein [Paenibacillus endoradicis]|uniref:hypothetical protein n=1 Tax=Paenibacillus endoradicis TaxID=2972487 RepID=UPI002158FF48|nr:hypothetical protein [Paenibacillus endoradicis]MCR8656635.1 hypothetical protein [Paenibacillus endoradicis]